VPSDLPYQDRSRPGRPLRLHRHQAEALQAAASGDNYVLTTGTGSGKSLSYIVPIVDRILRQGGGDGIKAIDIYPMNALANSQAGELRKFLSYGYPNGRGPVTFRRYTGQEDDAERRDIIANPPDILLTNFMMAELILTRVHEQGLVRAAQGLQFLVLDELHTYRGLQGADVALLIRRIRDACAADLLQCIGTSAALASGGTFDEQQAEVAAVASRLFGSSVAPERVIGETVHGSPLTSKRRRTRHWTRWPLECGTRTSRRPSASSWPTRWPRGWRRPSACRPTKPAGWCVPGR
jgi:ATP-dependent helicase YprA (DUF1998 family)